MPKIPARNPVRYNDRIDSNKKNHKYIEPFFRYFMVKNRSIKAVKEKNLPKVTWLQFEKLK